MAGPYAISSSNCGSVSSYQIILVSGLSSDKTVYFDKIA